MSQWTKADEKELASMEVQPPDPDDMGQTLATRLGDLVDTETWEDILRTLADIAQEEGENRCGRSGYKALYAIAKGLEDVIEAAYQTTLAADPPVLEV